MTREELIAWAEEAATAEQDLMKRMGLAPKTLVPRQIAEMMMVLQNQIDELKEAQNGN